MRGRALALLLSALLVVALAGMALAARRGPTSAEASAHAKAHGALGQQSNDDEAIEDGGVHGGPIERFHGPGCDVPDGADLPEGNWTHGDYVTAWAETGDEAKVQEAAHSRCGKPAHAAAGHGKKGTPPGLAKNPNKVPGASKGPAEPQPPAHT
ncbi:MAG: hypothetical protein ABR518_05180 [Actinomycetota bacterium]